jgi:hypothetical protein
MFVPKILPKSKRDAVRNLLDRGLSDYEIARRVGVNRGTVQNWRRRGVPEPVKQPTFAPNEWTRDRCAAYAYLFGLYLGDGYMGTHARTFSLIIACDGGYTDLVAECRCVVDLFAARPSALQIVGDTKGVRVVSYGQVWPHLFPQHGRGKKHERKIELVDWQQAIVERFPHQLLRGLVQSDGSRCQNTFKVKLKTGPKEYSYPRYFFTNYSTDIQKIFTDTCDQLGIRWSRSNWRNISIARRDSVALLDTFIGPKS